MSTPYLTVEQIAERLHLSRRSIHELTRTNAIPHRRIGGTRRCLFLATEIDEWVNGAHLEHHDAPNGGRIVKPATEKAA